MCHVRVSCWCDQRDSTNEGSTNLVAFAVAIYTLEIKLHRIIEGISIGALISGIRRFLQIELLFTPNKCCSIVLPVPGRRIPSTCIIGIGNALLFSFGRACLPLSTLWLNLATTGILHKSLSESSALLLGGSLGASPILFLNISFEQHISCASLFIHGLI